MASISVQSSSASISTSSATENTEFIKPSQAGSPFVKEIFAKFIHALDYHPVAPIANDNVSYQALQNEFAAYNTGAWFDALCRESATMAEVN